MIYIYIHTYMHTDIVFLKMLFAVQRRQESL